MVAAMANGRDVAPLNQDDVRLDVMLMSWLEAVRFRLFRTLPDFTLQTMLFIHLFHFVQVPEEKFSHENGITVAWLHFNCNAIKSNQAYLSRGLCCTKVQGDRSGYLPATRIRRAVREHPKIVNPKLPSNIHHQHHK